MVTQFRKLNEEDAALLFLAPVLVSILASWGKGGLSAAGKAEAIQMAHLKTFTADPQLLPYYKVVNNEFVEQFTFQSNKFRPFGEKQLKELMSRINDVNSTIAKLDPEYRQLLHKSLFSYAEHVKKASRGLIENFIFPIPINGFTV
jgi:hypothetical protein